MSLRTQLLPGVLFAAATQALSAGELSATRVAAVEPVAGGADCVVLAAGAAEGWREGMLAEVNRGGLRLATLRIVHVGEASAAAFIEVLHADFRIGVGDTVVVQLKNS